MQNLQPTNLTVQLADCSTSQPVGILEDAIIQVGWFVIPYDFIIMDIDGDFQTHLILGRPFLAIARVVIDVQADTLSFQLCGEREDFYFPPPTPSSVHANLPSPTAAMHHVPLVAISKTKVFDGDEGSCIRPVILSDRLAQSQPVLGSLLPVLGR